MSIEKAEAYRRLFKERQKCGFEMGHLETPLTGQEEMVFEGLTDLPSVQALLDWFPVFFEKYSNFAMPQSIFGMWQCRLLYYGYLQSDEMQELCRKEMEKWRSQLSASNTNEQPRQDPAHNAPTHIDESDHLTI